MIYVNAGHPPPLVLREHGELEALESGGVPLGIFETPSYFEGFAGLEEGDLMGSTPMASSSRATRTTSSTVATV